MTDILTRLRAAERDSVQTAAGSDIFRCAREEIESLRAQLAMPDGARRTACPACGWTFGTHAPHCTAQR